MHIFGYINMADLLTTLVVPTKGVWISGALVALTSFIQVYIYSSPDAIFFLYFLLGIDFLTGVLKALFINKDFSSKKLPRSAVSAVVYSLILGIGFNSAKHSMWFSLLPNFIYGVLISTLIVSIFENLTELKVIDTSIISILKEKVKDILKLNKGQ